MGLKCGGSAVSSLILRMDKTKKITDPSQPTDEECKEAFIADLLRNYKAGWDSILEVARIVNGDEDEKTS